MDSRGIETKWAPLTAAEGGNPAAITCTDNIIGLNAPSNAIGAIIVVRANPATADLSAAIVFSETAITDSPGNVTYLRANGVTAQHNEKILLTNKTQVAAFRMVSSEAGVQQSIRVQYYTNL